MAKGRGHQLQKVSSGYTFNSAHYLVMLVQITI